MNISKGLYETLTSKKITLEQKIEAVRFFAYPIHHLDGENEGLTEPGEITTEDAELLVEALKTGNFKELI